MRVLLIEDDEAIGAAVRDHIAADGNGVDWAQRLDSARDHLAVVAYELILLDMTLPDGRGIDLLHEIRAAGAATPVIIVTAQDQIASRIDGLNAGADDYLIKPFDLSELSARVAAVARRYGNNPSVVRNYGIVQLNFASRIAMLAERAVELSAREWAVLERLTQTANATVSKSEVEDSLYAFGAEIESNTVEVYVSRIRKKLGKDFIKTVRGLGYQVPVKGKSECHSPSV